MSESSSNVGRFFGYLLMAAAGLWIAFCGLCAASLIGEMARGGIGQEVIGLSFGVLLISGLGAAAGYAVFLVGRGLSRGR